MCERGHLPRPLGILLEREVRAVRHDAVHLPRVIECTHVQSVSEPSAMMPCTCREPSKATRCNQKHSEAERAPTSSAQPMAIRGRQRPSQASRSTRRASVPRPRAPGRWRPRPWRDRAARGSAPRGNLTPPPSPQRSARRRQSPSTPDAAAEEPAARCARRRGAPPGSPQDRNCQQHPRGRQRQSAVSSGHPR